MPRPQIEPGIYFDLPEDVYHAADGLSCSGMKQLSVSPLNYWHCNLNPDCVRPEETLPQRIGRALHCRLLEPKRYRECYAAQLRASDYPDAIVTMDDLKSFCSANGINTSAKRKQDLIDRILASGVPATIWDVKCEEHSAAHEGKTLLASAEADIIEGAAKVVADDPYATAVLTGGMPEVSFFVRDPETGVMLKARMDYVKPVATIDLKTFSNARGKPTDKVVFDAIYYEKYYLQTVFYHHVREIARRMLEAGEIQTHGDVGEKWLKAFTENDAYGFGFVFIESAPPFDLRIVQLRAAEASGADMNIYWTTGLAQIADLTALYAECVEKYGDNPWRESKPPYVLADTDMPQMLFT